MLLRSYVNNAVKQEWLFRFYAEQPLLYYFSFFVYQNNAQRRYSITVTFPL